MAGSPLRGAEYSFELEQDGIVVASVSGSDLEAVRREIWHYAMVYGQDGPVSIRGADVAALMPSVAAPIE